MKIAPILLIVFLLLSNILYSQREQKPAIQIDQKTLLEIEESLDKNQFDLTNWQLKSARETITGYNLIFEYYLDSNILVEDNFFKLVLGRDKNIIWEESSSNRIEENFISKMRKAQAINQLMKQLKSKSLEIFGYKLVLKREVQSNSWKLMHRIDITDCEAKLKYRYYIDDITNDIRDIIDLYSMDSKNILVNQKLTLSNSSIVFDSCCDTYNENARYYPIDPITANYNCIDITVEENPGPNGYFFLGKAVNDKVKFSDNLPPKRDDVNGLPFCFDNNTLNYDKLHAYIYAHKLIDSLSNPSDPSNPYPSHIILNVAASNNPIVEGNNITNTLEFGSDITYGDMAADRFHIAHAYFQIAVKNKFNISNNPSLTGSIDYLVMDYYGMDGNCYNFGGVEYLGFRRVDFNSFISATSDFIDNSVQNKKIQSWSSYLMRIDKGVESIPGIGDEKTKILLYELIDMLGDDVLKNIAMFAEFVKSSDLLTFEEKLRVIDITKKYLEGSGFNLNPYQLNGKVQFDINNDGCTEDDPANPFQKIEIKGMYDTEYIIGNQEGNYSLRLNEGNYKFFPVLENESLWRIEPDSFVVNFNNEDFSYEKNLCITPNGLVKDLEIVLVSKSDLRPGFDAEFNIKIKNIGNVVFTPNVKLTFPSDYMTLTGASPMVSSMDNDELNWNLGDLGLFEEDIIELVFKLNTPTDEFPLIGGEVLNFEASSSIEGDLNLTNNYVNLSQIVVNSYDPNDKKCYQGNTILIDSIGNDLTYLIRFENTGTADAINVIIRDSIDNNKFDINTLNILDASHELHVQIQDDNFVEFIFENIYLPFDEDNNDGYVQFSLKPSENIVIGNKIENEAEIYFDYNFPIRTKKFSTLVTTKLQTNEVENRIIKLLPNPVVDDLLVILGDYLPEHGEMVIRDIQGKEVQRSDIRYGWNSLSLAHFASGVYVWEFYDGKIFIKSGKLVKE